MDARRLNPLIIAATVFFLLTAFLARPVAGQWDSPDEMANAFWAGRVATGDSLVIRDTLVGIGRGAVHPRSFAVVAGALMPGSFPGLLFIYGMLNGFLRLPIWLLTPLITALAGLALARSLKPLFGERAAFWSGLLFFGHPAVIYYTSRGLFHNMLGIDLLIFAAYALASRPCERLWGARRADIDAIAAGGLFGLAMLTRLSEAVWAVPLLVLLVWKLGPKPGRRLAWIMVGASLPLFLLLEFNAAIYGSPLRTGYVIPTTPVADAVAVGAVAASPFAFHLRQALHNANAYGLRIFWWISLPSAAGFLIWLFGRRNRNRDENWYAAAALLTAVWLAAFYGSWAVQDRYDSTVTIGTSYARYFLPAYVLALPFAVKAFTFVSGAMRRRRAALFEAVIVVAALSVNIAVLGGDEGLRAVRATLAENAAKKPALLAAIPADAVVLTRRFDKVLFPDRLRVVPVFDAASFDAVAELSSYALIYYYGLDADPGERDLVTRESGARGLRLEQVATPWPGESLFRIGK